MKAQVYCYFQSFVLFSLCGNAGSPLHVYEQLLANGHIEKALHAPVGVFSLPTGIAIHYSIQDSKMHYSVEMLRIIFDQVATMFYKAEVLEGSNLLNCYSKLNAVSSVADLDLHAMSLTLYGAKRSFKKVEDTMIALQGEVHFLIETVRHRIRELRNEIQENEAQRQTIDQQIKTLDEQIRDNEDSSRDFDREADNMEAISRSMERESENSAKFGLAGVVGAVGAGVIGYFTGGIGYFVTGALIGSYGVKSVIDSENYHSRATAFRVRASMSRTSAHNLRHQVESSKRSKVHLKENDEHIQHQIIQLESSIRKVKDLSNSLHGSVDATNELVLMLQDTVISVTNAELNMESLKDRLKYLPNVIEKASGSVLKTTKAAWTSIHELLKIHHKLLT